MIITLLINKKKYSLILPKKVSGKYWIECIVNNKTEKVVSVEAVHGKWNLKTDKNYRIVEGKNELRTSAFSSEKMYIIKSIVTKQIGQLFSEQSEQSFFSYTKYKIESSKGLKIQIGRNKDNDIYVNNSYISEYHATLSFYQGKWTLTDNRSTNGTFVNNESIITCNLNPGDCIYIMGLQIIVGFDFFAVNNVPSLKINNSNIIPFHNISIKQSTADYDTEEEIFFYRHPRFKRNVAQFKLKIDAPPQSQLHDELPLWLTLGSSITMGMASVVTGTYAAINAISTNNIASSIPTMVMSFSMLVGTLVVPLITRKFEKRRKIKGEKKRQEKYKEYLSNIDTEINNESKRQCEILNENLIPAKDCLKKVDSLSDDIWERGIANDDFLTFRIGTGKLPLYSEISFPDDHFSLDDDNLVNLLQQLKNSPKDIPNAPVSVSLKENIFTAVYGKKTQCLSFAKGIIAQCVSFYGYDDVKLVFIYDSTDTKELSFSKWLPHVWSDDKKIRFIATNTEDLKYVSQYLNIVLENRKELDKTQREKQTPYYLICSFSKEMYYKSDFIKNLAECDEPMGFSVITFFSEFNDTPKECTSVISLNHDKGKIFDKNDTTGQNIDFVCDNYVHEDLTIVSKKLLGLLLDTGGSYEIPTSLPFLEFYNVGKVEHLNIFDKWNENDPTQSLKAEIGVDNHGDKVYLDLHEKYHGPHGLIAGMTGSGKSEFIITFILSLAINYHPWEVSFVLIDYKGGGMAKTFELLPHTAGIITNLDGATINRSLLSIHSELKRRQRLFSDASKTLKISNIDIYKYQKAFREKKIDTPLSHIFIIADEFAELKTQEPEFMAELVSTARIGRSLGVHLILATQKPNGVVDDQIWSNSKFRVCLKVQERADSMDMLKRPEAAYLKDTGRFYFQVGYNELFILGQSAWAGADYYPTDNIDIHDEPEALFVDMTGKVISNYKLATRTNNISSSIKQVDAITEYIYIVCQNERIKAFPLALPPLPSKLFYDELRKKYPRDNDMSELCALVGEIDDPANQRKHPMIINFTKQGNMILYGATGSGKDDFIIMLLFDLLANYYTDIFNAYIIDMGSEVLSDLAQAPQIGDIAYADDYEKIENLFKELLNELGRRKKLFAAYGGNITKYCNDSGNTEPNILVIINNYSAFRDAYEKFEYEIQVLSREGTKYGLFFVITCNGLGSIRFQMQQNFKTILTLQQNDKDDYNGIIGNTCGMVPSPIKGRGLIRTDAVYEFQTATPEGDEGLSAEIRRFINALCSIEGMKRAKRIGVLPKNVTLKDFGDCNISFLCVPYGIYKHDLSIASLNFSRNPFICISSANSLDCENLTMSIAWIAQKNIDIVKVFNNSHTIVDSNVLSAEDFIVAVFSEITRRHQEQKNDVNKIFQSMLIVIPRFSEFYENLSADGKDKFEVLMKQHLERYAVAFVVSDRIAEIKKYSIKPWYTASFSSNGLWVGNGAASQYVFSASNHIDSSNFKEQGFGYDYLGESAQLVKYITKIGVDNA